MVRDGSRIDDDTPAEALHDLRKRGKELRYLLELFGSPFPDDVVKPMVSTLKDLQDGARALPGPRRPDRAAAGGARRARGRARRAAALMAAGAALDALVADQHAARDEFAATFADFAGNGSASSSATRSRP